MTQTYPEDCPQIFFDKWWEEDKEEEDLVGGCLLKAYVPHVDQVPMALVPKGRTKAEEHDLADCEIIPANSKNVFQKSPLPVASIPTYKGEIRTVFRSKIRPVLLLISPYEDVPRGLMAQKPRRLTKPTAIVAPYYGRDEGTGKRSGYPQIFVDRVKHCEYPRFIWDILPIDGSEESIMRLDHLLPMSTNNIAFEKTGWKLNEQAYFVIMEWFKWFYTGELSEEPDSELPLIREELMKFESLE